MKYQWFGYQPMASQMSPGTVRPTLPKNLQDELIDDPPIFRELICVDSSRTNAIRELDERFSIAERHDFHKYMQEETDKREIEDYSHFVIGVPSLDQGVQVFFDWTPPSCDSPGCPYGATICSPFKVNPARTKKLAIGRIFISQQTETDLIVSSGLKALLHSEGITGLEYEPCVTTTQATSHEAAFFRARVTHTAPHRGSHIKLGNFCQKHMTATSPIVFDRQLLRDSLPDKDFLTINRAIVDSQEYCYNVPEWVVSKKVVKLLLHHKVPGLRRITVRLNQKFRPVRVSEV